MRTLATLAEYDPLTGYEPNDNRISEATELHILESSVENESLNSHDLEYDDYTIGMALSSPLFTQEREDAASRKTRLSLSRRMFVVQSVVVRQSC